MILFTDPFFVPDEEKFIHAFFENGLEILHLRKPESTTQQMQSLISKIDEKFHSRIMIHSHYQLLSALGLKGLHFNGKSKEVISNFRNQNCKKSLAIHDLIELKSVDASINYVFLSPIFTSVSKVGYSKQWDFEWMKAELCAHRNFKVVALGGITMDNAKQVKELGFDDFAVLGSIWQPVKAGCAFSEVLEIFNSFNP